MRPYRPIACALLFAAPLLPAAAANQPADSLLPPAIAGYELRTLDARKPVLFNVHGTWVRADLPVFFYFPNPMPPQAAPLLRQIYDDLLKLGRKPEWTAAELQGVIANLDAAIRLMEQPAANQKKPD